VETRGVYIQDVTFSEELVMVLTQREVAKREKTPHSPPHLPGSPLAA